MKKIQVTKQLLDTFKSNPQTLIFYGYLTTLDDVQVFQDGQSFAFIANNGKFLECGIVTEDMAFVDEFLSTFQNVYAEFRMITPQIASYLEQKYQFVYHVSCGLYVWNGKPLPYKCSQDLRPVDEKFASIVAKGTDYASADDVLELLRLHPSSALYVDEQPVCWCLLHLEKALGMLYTLPEHRHKGYALEVMTDLTNKVIANGDVPYASIVKGNVASQNLAQKYNIDYVCDVDYVAINFDGNHKK